MFNIKVSRRLISFVLVFIMIFSMSSTVVYADSTNSQDGYTTAVEKQAQYQNSISQFHSKFSDKEFGGMYYDDDSVLCINLIESSSKLSEARSYIYTVSQSLKNHKGIQDGIRINYVKYSLYDLRSSVTSITNHMKELGVTGAGVDQRNNQISIYIPKGTQLDEDLIKSLVSVDEQHIKIIENEYVAAFTAGVTVRPGTYGTVGSGSFTMSWGGPLSRNCALREVGLRYSWACGNCWY